MMVVPRLLMNTPALPSQRTTVVFVGAKAKGVIGKTLEGIACPLAFLMTFSPIVFKSNLLYLLIVGHSLMKLFCVLRVCF